MTLLQVVFTLTLTSLNLSEYVLQVSGKAAARQEMAGVGHKWKRSSSIPRILSLPLSVFSTAFHLTTVHCAPAWLCPNVSCPVSSVPLWPNSSSEWTLASCQVETPCPTPPWASIAGIFSLPFTTLVCEIEIFAPKWFIFDWYQHFKASVPGPGGPLECSY